MLDTLRHHLRHKSPKASPWVGWIAFAGVCMVMLGSFHMMQGLIAIVDADYFPIAGDGPVTGMSLDTWGWVHLIGGAVLLFAGLCVFAGQVWARTPRRPGGRREPRCELRLPGRLSALVADDDRSRRRHHLGPHRSRLRHQALTRPRTRRGSRPHPQRVMQRPDPPAYGPKEAEFRNPPSDSSRRSA